MSPPETVMTQDGVYYRFLNRAPVTRLLDRSLSTREWFEADATTLKTNSNKTRTHLIVQGDTRYFVKRYQSAGLPVSLFVTDRALVVYRHSVLLQRVGIPVARPLAYIREGSRAASATSYFVCEALNEMVDLRHLSETADFEMLLAGGEMFSSIARDIARLHRLGFCHGDMKWANIMVNPRSQEYRLVDLDGLHKPRLRRSTLFAKDIARFIMNAREKKTPEHVIESFICCYAGERGVDVALLRAGIDPVYEKLLHRHRQDYGVELP